MAWGVLPEVKATVLRGSFSVFALDKFDRLGPFAPKREMLNPPKGIIMLKSSHALQPNRLGDAAMAASRQVWLASLGAAVVTRDWVQTEAGGVFKSLVKEGAVVESQAVRFVGDRLETSLSMANTVWKQTRRTVESTVKQAADATVSFAQQVLPRSLPAFELPKATKAKQAVAKSPKRAVRPVKAVRRTKRAGRTATKRK